MTSFLFAVFHMNVFLLPPLFVLGVALGVLALRSGSLAPGIILHGSGNALLILGPQAEEGPLGYAVLAGCAAAAAALLWWQNRRAGPGLVAQLLGVPVPEVPVPEVPVPEVPVPEVPR